MTEKFFIYVPNRSMVCSLQLKDKPSTRTHGTGSPLLSVAKDGDSCLLV